MNGVVACAAATHLFMACGSKREPPQTQPPAPGIRVIAPSTSQLVTAIVPDWTATTAELRLWQRADGHASWSLIRGPWTAVVGRTGTAWGIGLHGDGAPEGRAGPTKREGDGKSPAGTFAIRKSYGYAPSAPGKTAVPYVQVDERHQCVDDSRSRHYATIIDQTQVSKDWSSAEDMRRSDDLYKWVIDVAHNPSATAGAGSCIFLHVWSAPSSSTAGCTAMPEDALASLLESLSPAASPAFVLLPQAEYDALAPRWDLPR